VQQCESKEKLYKCVPKLKKVFLDYAIYVYPEKNLIKNLYLRQKFPKNRILFLCLKSFKNFESATINNWEKIKIKIFKKSFYHFIYIILISLISCSFCVFKPLTKNNNFISVKERKNYTNVFEN